MALLRRRLDQIRRDDAGFTLIESIVALIIAAMLFTALAGILVSAVKTSVFGRQNQQAADLMTQKVEQLRLLGHSELAHTSVVDDDNLITCSSGFCLPVDDNGTTVEEPVVVDAGGAVTTQSEALMSSGTNQTSFTRKTYVTETAEQEADQVKRVTVVISWSQGGKTRTRSTSTLLAYTQRGLPVPVFKLQLPQDTITKNPGARITFVLTLSNQGAPDRWDLTLGGPGAADGWQLIRDTPTAADPAGDGAFDAAEDVALTDTTGNGITDTGRLEPSESLVFFLTRETASTEASSARDVTVRAESVGQPYDATDPDTASSVAEVVAKPVVTTSSVVPSAVPSFSPAPADPSLPADCAGVPATAMRPSNPFSLETLTLHNDPQGDTAQVAQLYMNRNAADEPSLGKYATDVAPSATGRHILPFGTTAPAATTFLSSTDKTRVADWAFQLPKATEVGGTAVLRLWVARADTGSGAVSLHAVPFSATASGSTLSRTAIGSGTTTSVATLTCPGFQEVQMSIALPTTSIAKNAWFGVRVATLGTDATRLAYDVPTGASRPYPAGLTVATK